MRDKNIKHEKKEVVKLSELQLSILDEEINSTPTRKNVEIAFEINDRVRATIPEYKMIKSEPFFYIKLFLNKRGVITKVTELPSLQYDVSFGNKIAILYHDELLPGWPQ